MLHLYSILNKLMSIARYTRFLKVFTGVKNTKLAIFSPNVAYSAITKNVLTEIRYIAAITKWPTNPRVENPRDSVQWKGGKERETANEIPDGKLSCDWTGLIRLNKYHEKCLRWEYSTYLRTSLDKQFAYDLLHPSVIPINSSIRVLQITAVHTESLAEGDCSIYWRYTGYGY